MKRLTVLVLGLMSLGLWVCLGASAAQTAPESPQQLKATCVKAGLAKPAAATGHFWMYVDEYTTGPHAGLGYKLLSMPESCFGKYRRILFANFRYKTTRKGWRTYHGIAAQGGATWHRIDGQDFASGTYKSGETPVELSAEWGGPENTQHTSEWGKLEQAKGRVRLWVTDIGTHRVVGRKTYNIPTHICRHYIYYGKDLACAWR